MSFFSSPPTSLGLSHGPQCLHSWEYGCWDESRVGEEHAVFPTLRPVADVAVPDYSSVLLQCNNSATN